MDKIDYFSGDPSSLAPDEALLWSGTHLIRRGGCLSTLLVFAWCAGGIAVVAILSKTLLVGFAGTVVIAFGVCVGVSVLLLGARDNLTFTQRERQVRLTDRRLVSRESAASFQQLSYADLREFTLTQNSARSTTELVAGDCLPQEDEDLEVQQIKVPAGEQAEARQLLKVMAERGVIARAEARRWRRAWRPATVAEVAPMSPTPMAHASQLSQAPLELIEGEPILWQGRPQLVWRRDLAARCIAMLKSSPWTLAAVGALAFALRNGTREARDYTFLILIGAVTLVIQFAAHLWSPMQRVRTLRRTDYTLTTHRLIVRVTRRASTQTVSKFFDGDQQLALETLGDGRGTITIGFGTQLELIPSAAVVHALALRAVAGFGREGAATPVAEPAE